MVFFGVWLNNHPGMGVVEVKSASIIPSEEVNPCLVEGKPGSFVGGLVPTAIASTPSTLLIPPTGRDEPPTRPYSRAGIGVSAALPVKTLAARLGAGWYLDWQVHAAPEPAGLVHWQTIRVSTAGAKPSLACAQYIARRNPGQTWVIGNEPDVIWQDNTPPDIYAHHYGTFYRGLKAVDPRAKIAVGGVAAATPLRFAYLERVLAAYQEKFGEALQADWWTVHIYILREEQDSWGIGIPPGIPAERGILYEVRDHARLDLFEAQIRAFREWMAAHGYRHVPLAVTEFGILMPNEYGFPPELVANYLTQTFELLDSLHSVSNGLAGDNNRLVQRWAWFSLADPIYPVANLVDPTGEHLTPAGKAFQEFVKQRP